MEYLLIVLVFVLFALPGLLLSRTNRKRMDKARAVQAAAHPGDRIITVSGFHGRIVSAGEATVDVELAPDVVVTMEREGVYKVLDPEPAAGATVNQPGDAVAQENPRTEDLGPEDDVR